jgi:transcriptional regulator with XRE-family HTH domain
LKVALASMLRRVRQQQRLSQTAAAKLVHSSQSRLAKMEAADKSVTVDLMFRSLFRLGAELRDIVRVSKRAPAAVTAYAVTKTVSARKSAKPRSQKTATRTHDARSLKRSHASHART